MVVLQWFESQQSQSMDITQTKTPHLFRCYYLGWECSYSLWFTISTKLDNMGEKDVHQLVGGKGSMISFVKADKSWQHCAASPGQYHSYYTLQD